MRTLLPIAISFLCSLPFGSAQVEAIDSLRRAYWSAPTDSVRWDYTKQLFSAFTQMSVDSAMVYAQTGMQLAQEGAVTPLQRGMSYDMLGRAFMLKSQFQQSLEHFVEASRIYQELGATRNQFDVESAMASLYIKQGNYESAEALLHKTVAYFEANPEPNIMTAYTRLVMLYQEQGKYPDSVVSYAQKALEIGERYQLSAYLPALRGNLASAYHTNGEYDKAIAQYRSVLEQVKVMDASTLHVTTFGLAELFLATGQPDSSLYYSLQTVDYAKKYGDLRNEGGGYEIAAKAAAALGDFEKAFDYQIQFQAKRDSFQQELHSRDMAELNVKYETQQKEAQIVQQELDLERETNRRNLILLAALMGLGIGISCFVYIRNQQRQLRKQAQLALQVQAAKSEQLEELDRLKSNFFANLSHEFRTPLSLILGPLREYQQGTLRGELSAYVKTMTRNGERLLRLVNQLLELSRLESGATKLEERPVDIVAYLRSTAASFEHLALRRQIYFQQHLPKEGAVVYIDTDKLEKVVTNLLSNAFKFTPEEGRVSLQLRVAPDDATGNTQVQLRVTDSGIGIPADQLSHVFDRFYSQAKFEDELGNTGIGLALTKELVELQGGQIWVESEVDKGSTFGVDLLLKTAPATEAVAPPTAPTTNEPPTADTAALAALPIAANGHHSKVVIVEDHPDLRQYIQNHFQTEYQVLEATNGKQGIELATTHIPDLVISDIAMPHMDGLELCRHLKRDARTSHIPIILLTAHADQASKLEGLAEGADAYLTKPFDLQELDIRVAKLIERSRTLRQKFATEPREDTVGIKIKTELVQPAEEAFLEKVVDVIESHLDDEAFGVEELSKNLGMSRSQLHRKMKALTDQSPSVFVRTIRLQHAYQLLKRRVGNVSEIAFRVGFSNLPYFSRSFANQFGFPPSSLLQQETP